MMMMMIVICIAAAAPITNNFYSICQEILPLYSLRLFLLIYDAVCVIGVFDLHAVCLFIVIIIMIIVFISKVVMLVVSTTLFVF